MKKWNNFLNVMIGAFIGSFVGTAIAQYMRYQSYPELYAMQPVPWYSSIMVNGLVTIVIILIALVLKWIIKRRGDVS